MHWTTATIRIPDKVHLSREEVAVALGVSRRTLKRWIDRGQFPPPNFGRKWSAMSVGVWLAYQDYCRPPGIDDGGDDDDEDDEKPPKSDTPVKGK